MKHAENKSLEQNIKNSWSKIAPFWPLQNLIATNPLTGFEDRAFEDTLTDAQIYFQQKELPEGMRQVNRQTIKWLQLFFDEGQATIGMPLRNQGLLISVVQLLRFDTQAHLNNTQKQEWLKKLPGSAQGIIKHCLEHLDISSEEQELFMTLMLTTLPGWAAHVTYRTNWAEQQKNNPVTKEEYLALRLVLTCLVWPEAQVLLLWHQDAVKNADTQKLYAQIKKQEQQYTQKLLSLFEKKQVVEKNTDVRAQFVFCIDVRSEPFRRALEAQGKYETFGFAGFFGVPVTIFDAVTQESYVSCPAPVPSLHTVTQKPVDALEKHSKKYALYITLKKIYQSVKHTFATPFDLVEAAGPVTGALLALKTFVPKLSVWMRTFLQRIVVPSYKKTIDITSIQFDAQVKYAFDTLRMMGLTKDFAPFVIFTGHASQTENNSHASMLDCGACAGNAGGNNASILAMILNTKEVRVALAEQNISIPETTVFVAGEHNTTTDQVKLYDDDLLKDKQEALQLIKNDLEAVWVQNNVSRAATMGIVVDKDVVHNVQTRSHDWAQTRPEWGLAKNASFIIAPRRLTQAMDLEGRSFLHSYEWQQDEDGVLLTKILTAPVVVGQWINMQYFFSTFDPVAFGAGSKVTSNITGCMGVMQGNASDLMTGLPLQSVYRTDTQAYHELQRLTVLVYAPQLRIVSIIKAHAILQKLFGNGWVHVICIDPETNEQLKLQRDFSWENLI